MKIVVFEIEDWERASFDSLTKDHEVIFCADPLDAGNVGDYADADIISVFIYSDVGADIIKQMPNLKMVATRSTGFDHIDTGFAANKNIVVSNVPVYGEATVAEHVFALLLTISHHMTEAVKRTRDGDFHMDGLQGFDLQGKTLGVIGTGSIGLHVTRIAKGFGMTVIASDIAEDHQAAQEYGFSYAPFEQVLQQADIITLHVPGGDKTENLIDAKAITQMKKGVVLINTARGSVVDIEALTEGLSSGHIKAAGLDVLAQEPLIREEAELWRDIVKKPADLKAVLLDHVLLRMKNVYVTPHSAFNTREAVLRILTTTEQNITGFLNGKPINTAG